MGWFIHIIQGLWCSWVSLPHAVVFQLLSHVQPFGTPWTAARQAPLSFSISWSLLKFMSIESVMLSNHLILCCPFSFCLQSFPASGSFPMSWFLASCGQSIRASVTVLPMTSQGWFPIGFTGLISWLSKGFPRVFSSTTVGRHQFFGALPTLQFSSHNHTWPMGT